MNAKTAAKLIKSIELALGTSRGAHMNYDPHLGFATDDAVHSDLDVVRELFTVITDEKIGDAELERVIAEDFPWLKDKAAKLASLRKNPRGR